MALRISKPNIKSSSLLGRSKAQFAFGERDNFMGHVQTHTISFGCIFFTRSIKWLIDF